MKNKIRMMKFVYRAPTILEVFRSVVTMVIFVWNPTSIPLRFLQIVPLLSILVYAFMYRFLFLDSVPLVAVVLPNLIHIALVSFLSESFIITPFIPIVVIDTIYIIVKVIKSTAFPFEIEG